MITLTLEEPATHWATKSPPPHVNICVPLQVPPEVWKFAAGKITEGEFHAIVQTNLHRNGCQILRWMEDKRDPVILMDNPIHLEEVKIKLQMSGFYVQVRSPKSS